MASVPPPQGMDEHDYETIEAAVTETVRGRWFLAEFARRNRSAEMRQLLDAMGRLEGVVAAGQQALQPTDPSIRLLMARIKEIAGQLGELSSDMRGAGLDPHFAEAVDRQAKAVAGMMRGGAPRPTLPSGEERLRSPQPQPPIASLAARMPRIESPAAVPAAVTETVADDPRLAALSTLDNLSLAEKLALFS